MNGEGSERQISSLFKRTGLFFALNCGAYLLLYLGAEPFRHRDIRALWEVHPMLISVAIFSTLFTFSAFKPKFHWIQPILLLALTPLPMIYAHVPAFGLGVFIAAEILLFRLGFFDRWKLSKFAVSILYFFLCQAITGLRAGVDLTTILFYLLFLLLFLLFLLIVYGERWIVYLREPKPLLKLSSMGINGKESAYLKSLLADKPMKVIAQEHGVSESTVRNTLARVYRKFHVHDKSELKAKCAGFSLLD